MKKNIFNKILIVLFSAFLGITGILYIVLPKNDYSETEKRYLAAFPDISFESVKSGKFTSGLNTYLEDHTPLRKFWVSVHAYFELAKGNNGYSGVYLGKKGWLIEKPVDRNNLLLTNLERIGSFTDKTGLPASVIAIPSKGSIYNEYLPKCALDYKDIKYIQMVIEALSGTAKVIDVRTAFNSVASETQLYYRTDHHWTTDGAFIAYGEICRALGFKIKTAEDYDCETYSGFFGTSFSASCYTLTKPDDIKIMRSKLSGGFANVVIIEGKKSTEYSDMFFTSHLDEGDKYLTFLDGNHSLVDIKTGNSGKKLLLIKDSFAHCLAPFLADNYSEILMLDLRYYPGKVSELIEEYGIEELMFVYGIENLCESRDIILN